MALLVALISGCAAGDEGAARAGPWDTPGRLAALPDGRKINLRCRGSGTPTVLLEAGFGASSSAWFKVQDTLAKTSRVCAYDRAGYGFSDPGPLPRDGDAIARDLDQALTAAKIDGPYVVVGHSAGGFYTRLFTARRAAEVKGLVLLDPTIEQLRPQPSGDGLDGIRSRVRRCLTATEAKPQPALDSPAWSGCLPPKGELRALENAQRPQTWTAQLSELDTLFNRTSEQVLRSRPVLAATPIYVITASATSKTSPVIGFAGRTAVETRHMMMAQASRNGSQQTIQSPHLVMIERPDVVIATVQEMVAAAKAGREPKPLPPSEIVDLPDSGAPPAPAPDPLKELTGALAPLTK